GETLDVPQNESLELRLGENLHERDPFLGGEATDFLPGRQVGGDGRGGGRDSVAGQDARDVTDPAHVGIAVLFRELELGREIRSDLVAVQDFDGTLFLQVQGERRGERAL